MPMSPANQYAIVVDAQHVKTVKTCLESNDLYNKSLKIRTFDQADDRPRFAIPTNISTSKNLGFGSPVLVDTCEKTALIEQHELHFPGLLNDEFQLTILDTSDRPDLEKNKVNPLQRAVLQWLNEVPAISRARLPSQDHLLASLPKAYNVYPPMLLLPVNLFEDVCWQALQTAFAEYPKVKDSFFESVSSFMGVTRIAINAAIPQVAGNLRRENVVRSPVNLEPLYGDFGPKLAPFPDHAPSEADFCEALWVSTKQNGITQIWAPRYTMFSAGNVTEKARILNMTSVKDAIDHGRLNGVGCTAVDLFAGIGYFAFSYAKAGITKVLCWDLNPWSVEGLRRGAEANKWTCQMLGSAEGVRMKVEQSQATFLVFTESNTEARARIQDLRDTLPPIRHVNCGTLPTIGQAWRVAIEAIDPFLGGWIHIHETVDEKDFSRVQRDYVHLVQEHFDSLPSTLLEKSQIALEHVERVKSMGPRLWHLVLDFRIGPRLAFPTST